MIPTTEEIARQLAVMAELNPDDTVSELAHKLGFPPLLIINALAEAERMELLSSDKENDRVSLVSRVNYFAAGGTLFGSESTRLQDEIVLAVTDANSNQKDLSVDQLKYWCVGVRESAVEIALKVLRELGHVAFYTLKDPKDEESEYEFITLAANKDHQWGASQFVERPETDKQ